MVAVHLVSVIRASVEREPPRSLPKRALAHLRQFRSELAAALPNTLEQVILFGSRARGGAKWESDDDVAVLVREAAPYRGTCPLVTETAYPHLLAGFPIRAITLPHDYLDRADVTPLAAEITADGVAIRRAAVSEKTRSRVRQPSAGRWHEAFLLASIHLAEAEKPAHRCPARLMPAGSCAGTAAGNRARGN